MLIHDTLSCTRELTEEIVVKGVMTKWGYCARQEREDKKVPQAVWQGEPLASLEDMGGRWAGTDDSPIKRHVSELASCLWSNRTQMNNMIGSIFINAGCWRVNHCRCGDRLGSYAAATTGLKTAWGGGQGYGGEGAVFRDVCRRERPRNMHLKWKTRCHWPRCC